jgi:uncharacterized integral membrane protein
MKTFLKWLILAPIALAIIAFAILNRQNVPVVIDPFGSDIGGLAFQAPLFFVMFLCGTVGVVAGSFVTWIGQGKHRRAAREAKAEVARLRALAPPPPSLYALPPSSSNKAA